MMIGIKTSLVLLQFLSLVLCDGETCTFSEVSGWVDNCYSDVDLHNITGIEDWYAEDFLKVAYVICRNFSLGSRCVSKASTHCNNSMDIFHTLIGKVNICKATRIWIIPYLAPRGNDVIVTKVCFLKVLDAYNECFSARPHVTPGHVEVPPDNSDVYAVYSYMQRYMTSVLSCIMNAASSGQFRCNDSEPRDAILALIMSIANDWSLGVQPSPSMIMDVLEMPDINVEPTWPTW